MQNSNFANSIQNQNLPTYISEEQDLFPIVEKYK